MSREHGRRATYQSGCRCDACRRANADYCRDHVNAYRDRNRAKRTFVAGRWIAPLPDESHGTLDAYSHHCCRCISCTRAMREYKASRRAS